ncbi:MAG: hypothetical protein JO205_02815, partial [Pseudolabrys sp.]|nr:hypothetical protein [Pseudolabrys sp.]
MDADAVVARRAESPAENSMRVPSQHIARGTALCRILVPAMALTLLAGCANGDFGEVKPTLVRDDIHNWVPFDEATGGVRTPPSRFELTDDERQLRDLAYPLIEPPYDRKQWYSIAGEYGWLSDERRATYDRTTYATRLFADSY